MREHTKKGSKTSGRFSGQVCTTPGLPVDTPPAKPAAARTLHDGTGNCIPTPDLQKFFTTFYAAVHYLMTAHRAMDLNTPHIAPTPSLVFVGENCLTPDNIHMPARVFKKYNCIHKLYDTVKLSVNLDILCLLHTALIMARLPALSLKKMKETCLQRFALWASSG